ncbi:MAG: hypothetical protein LC775_00375 [Acidobacteria bacterium]|nr:hypothetical protein [Acidobacteriota bacterium]
MREAGPHAIASTRPVPPIYVSIGSTASADHGEHELGHRVDNEPSGEEGDAFHREAAKLVEQRRENKGQQESWRLPYSEILPAHSDK